MGENSRDTKEVESKEFVTTFGYCKLLKVFCLDIWVVALNNIYN